MNDIKESNEPDTKKRKANDESTPRKEDELVSCNNKTQIDIDSFNNDIVIRFASYLSSRDLVSLALTCRKFGSRRLHDRELSLVETTQRRKLCVMPNKKKEKHCQEGPIKHTLNYIQSWNSIENHEYLIT